MHLQVTPYEALKARAQLFKAGSIVPRRAIKCTKRKFQHLLKFANDTYLVPGPHGYVAFSEDTTTAWCCRIKTKLTLVYNGAPYHAHDIHFKGFVWCKPGSNVEEFQARVLEAMKPSQVRWIDNSKCEYLI